MRFVSFESEFGTIALGDTVKLTSNLKGTGLPPVSVQWFEGAGDGANYRGARVLPRTMDLPLSFYGTDRNDVWNLFSQVAVIFAPNGGQVRMRMELDGEVWFTDVVRTGGGDWSWDSDTDGRSFLRTVLTVQAGDPYWTREDATSQVISPGGLGRGLIKQAPLSNLELSTTNSLGAVLFENPGDVAVFPVWTLQGPFSQAVLTSPSGEELVWIDDLEEGETLTIDTAAGTVKDQTGANRYGSLGPVPRFWSIPPGNSNGEVELLDAVAPGSLATVIWQPKKWVVF
jgi:hypothetical protein